MQHHDLSHGEAVFMIQTILEIKHSQNTDNFLGK